MFKIKKQINFLQYSKFLTPFSLLLSLGALFVILVMGFKYGIDFAGGVEVQVRFKQAVQAEEIRQSVQATGISNPTVQSFGEKQEFIIRIDSDKKSSQKLENLKARLVQDFSGKGLEIRRIDYIGPQIGKELRQKGILAVIYSLMMILIYLGLRFDIRYAPAAVVCLFHDAIITLSIFSIFGLEVNVQTLAAILAIIGYSLNDTIVTFDRIRENQQVFQGKKSFYDICQMSLNHVLSRTLLTSFTTLLAIASMWALADGVIKDFAFTLAIGVTIGTYSSIYIATPLLIFINQFKVFQKN